LGLPEYISIQILSTERSRPFSANDVLQNSGLQNAERKFYKLQYCFPVQKLMCSESEYKPSSPDGQTFLSANNKSIRHILQIVA
jgi:hypothetical protein